MAQRRDTDLSARARFFQAIGWSFFPALIMGIMVTIADDVTAGFRTFGLVVGIAGGGSLLFSEIIGRTTAQLLHPTSSNRTKQGYSGATALAAKGRYREAIDAYERASLEDPDDPLPCLKMARIYTERMGNHDSAMRWFREGLSRDIHPGEARAVMREIVEAAERGGNGLKAAPDLARYAEAQAGTPEETWARRVLAELKSEMRDRAEHTDDSVEETPDEEYGWLDGKDPDEDEDWNYGEHRPLV